MSVTEMGAARAVRSLMQVYTQPRDEDATVAAFRMVLDDVSDEELQSVVRQYLKSDRQYFPKPGTLRQMALENRPAAEAHTGPIGWDQLQDGPCPVCGAVLQLGTDPTYRDSIWDAKLSRMRKRTKEDPPPNQKYILIHDYATHARAGKNGFPIVGAHNGPSIATAG